jgi:chromatin segregation and condensation protein Rec8/ScpA/Scc1 (kleisin family)
MEKEVKKNNQVGQDQLYDLLTSRELSWQAILLDLINSEQLDPWNIDLGLLSQKYLKKIRELQEANFFISSKVLLAAAFLLRIKSEILHTRIKDIDELLFEKKQKPRDELAGLSSIFELAEEEMPEILPRTPLPRFKKITMNELMSALDTALKTEHRRIKRELFFKRAERALGVAVFQKPLKDITKKVSEVYSKIKELFKKHELEKLTFSKLAGEGREERIATFVPLLHLDHKNKIILAQEVPFSEIDITLKK